MIYDCSIEGFGVLSLTKKYGCEFPFVILVTYLKILAYSFALSMPLAISQIEMSLMQAIRCMLHGALPAFIMGPECRDRFLFLFSKLYDIEFVSCFRHWRHSLSSLPRYLTNGSNGGIQKNVAE